MGEHGGLIAVGKVQSNIRRNSKVNGVSGDVSMIGFIQSYLNFFAEISSIFST